MSDKILNRTLQEITYNFFKKNIKNIIILLTILIFILFSFFLYQHLQDKSNKETSEQYTKASILINKDKKEDSKPILINIINKKHSFYSPLALFLIINNNMEENSEKIINYFDQILKIRSIDDENLNLIKIKKAFFLFNTDNEELIVKTLNPVINSNSVWKNMATQLITDYFLSRGEFKKADEYKRLINNTSK